MSIITIHPPTNAQWPTRHTPTPTHTGHTSLVFISCNLFLFLLISSNYDLIAKKKKTFLSTLMTPFPLPLLHYKYLSQNNKSHLYSKCASSSSFSFLEASITFISLSPNRYTWWKVHFGLGRRGKSCLKGISGACSQRASLRGQWEDIGVWDCDTLRVGLGCEPII